MRDSSDHHQRFRAADSLATASGLCWPHRSGSLVLEGTHQGNGQRDPRGITYETERCKVAIPASSRKEERSGGVWASMAADGAKC